METNDLYLDDADMAFNMLDDNDDLGISFSDEGMEMDKNVKRDLDGYGDYEDADDLFEESFAEEGGNEEFDLEEEESGETQTNASTDFNTLSDDDEIVLGDSRVSKRELTELMSQRDSVKDSYKSLSGFSAAMEQRDVDFQSQVFASSLECDKQIAAIKNHMDNPSTSAEDRGKLYLQLQNLKSRKGIISAESDKFKKNLEETKMETIKQRYQTMNAEMSKEVTNWAETGTKLQEFVSKSGMAENDLHQVVSPAFARILMKAMKYDDLVSKNESTVKQKLKAKPQRAVKSGASQNKSNNSGKRQKVLNDLKRTGYADADEMFDFLED